LFIAIMKLGAILIPIGNISTQMTALANGWAIGRMLIDGLGGNFALYLALVAFAPFMTLYMFSFLNKRNASDFVHSLPHKRETLFVSYTAAVLTWVLGGLWLSVGITLVIYMIGSAYVLVNVSSMLLVALGLSAGCFLVIAATLMAMSVTGGVFSNITTALLILFLPRTISYVFSTFVIMGTGHLVPLANFGLFGDFSFHIPFSFLYSILESFRFRFELSLIHGALYTAVLGLVYLAVALVLFKRRRSETAGSPAQSGVLQAAIRIAVAFVVCLVPIALILGGGAWRDLIMVIAVLWCGAGCLLCV